QVAGCIQGVEAVARELRRRDIVPDVAALRTLGQQVPDELVEVLLRSGDVLTSMQECRKLGVVVLVENERECLEHGFEPVTRVASLMSELGEMFEVAAHQTLMPCEQDRFDVCEVLVQRRTTDAGLLGDL